MEDRDQDDGDLECGGAFSALCASMRPGGEVAETGGAGSDPNSQPLYRWDEFGFRVEEEDGPEDTSSKLLSLPFEECGRRRLQWAVELELGQWDRLKTEGRLQQLVREGVPHSLRSSLWPRLLDTQAMQSKMEMQYTEVVSLTGLPGASSLQSSRQIEKDLLRTLPTNVCFSGPEAVGVPRLRRVLRGIAHVFPDIGYCQGMGMIAATLLLFLKEEDAFWMMVCIVKDLLPSSYYSANLWGAQADQLVLRSLVATHLPRLDSLLSRHSIELSLITLHWFLTLFTSVLHIRLTVRVWDRLFQEGNSLMFRVALGMLHLAEEELLKVESSADMFSLLSLLPGRCDCVDSLLAAAESCCGQSLDLELVDGLRRKHLGDIMADITSYSGVYREQSSVPRPWSSRRRLNRSKSIVDILLRAQAEDDPDPRCKNVRRTELFVFLRESILRIGTFFQGLDSSYQGVSLAPDYSLESHTTDLATFLATSTSTTKRARALTDFERKDDDELGFRKNDLIVVRSQKDEHCWVGELNGGRGWFPAKLVQLVDERSKSYSYAGDDRVNQAITDIVRGSLCPAIKHLLEQGLQRSSVLAGPLHPWQFVVEAAAEAVSADYSSVFSRLVLCKTFRLEEDGKVLSPEELLYRCVALVGRTHDKAGAQMDVKLRSLICLGLNEQVLHLWLEVLCSAEAALAKWYSPHSLLASPGWVLLKCELRTLAQFSFQLSHDWELPGTGGDTGIVRQGVRDMLVTHHLFSWDM